MNPARPGVARLRAACTFGEVFSTDVLITSLHLTVLEDDRHFFPADNAALTVRGSVMKALPQTVRSAVRGRRPRAAGPTVHSGR